MEVTSFTKRRKRSSSNDNACMFLRQQGNYSLRVCPWGTNCHCKFLFECSGTPIEEESPCPVRVLSTRQLVSSSRQCTGSPGSCCTRIFSPKTSVRAPSSAPVIIFCSPNWSHHWKSACLKMFKTSKQLWHSLRAIPQEDVQRSFQSLLIVPLAVSMQKGCTLNKIQIALKSFVPVFFYNLSLIT